MTLLALTRPTTVTAQSLTITDAVTAALHAHPAVAAATARVEAAEGAGDAARAARLPGASVEGTLTRFQEPMIVAPFHSLDFSSPPTFDRTLVQGRLALAYTVFDGGERSARIRGADAMEEASTYGLSAAEMTVIEETASAYVGVLSAQAGLDAANAQVGALQEEADRAQRQLDAGTAPEVEVLRARASLQDARARQASAEARVGLAVRALARQMSADPATLSPLSLSDVTVAPGTTLSSESQDVSASPVVQRADRAALAARARVSEERAGRLPTVQAGAGVLDYGTLDDDHVLEWQAGLQVSWPLFTGGARSASVRRAEAELAAARNELEATRLQVAQTVDAAETAVVEADARAEALELAVTQWEEVSRIEALALDAGSGVQADRLRAEAGLYQARAGYAQARYDAVLSRIRLARAAGTLDLNWMAEALEASR
ncbi:MAG: TolC family protein [Gemmatimonadota bacterium]|jgi:outer membrane protein